ncbi:rhodanese-like domain-containing protein [Deinococcus detaillensis]|uniref:Rhodanese-like domain-containing protein n=1 Tax=Deinococcus detaillensis TaxID=2592048 RepID=A0A553UZ41_9DEIO|nr:rhodanese-like domain-containing protein [Deinococcus detaillensis]TSA85468.1 rhodanese-like domain-containing protein [Deinococcus detaillensis]
MHDIFPNEVGEWLKRGARIIDVREPQEYLGGHLPGPVNIPLGELGLGVDLRCTEPQDTSAPFCHGAS